jgi:hypothetical protein
MKKRKPHPKEGGKQDHKTGLNSGLDNNKNSYSI